MQWLLQGSVHAVLVTAGDSMLCNAADMRQ
jgi:hypothetical protein